MLISFKVRLFERVMTWTIILILPFACLLLLAIFRIQDPNIQIGLFIPQFEKWFQHVWLILILLGIIAGLGFYIRFRGPLITKYCLSPEGIWFREYGDWGVRTSLAMSRQPWSEINGVRINEQGKIRLVFQSGDSVESKWPVADPNKFQHLSRKQLEQFRKPDNSQWETRTRNDKKSWDVFISHASEDKDSFVRALATALTEKGLSVWYDEHSLRIGDSLRRSIDQGLLYSEFGIVVISPRFLAKEWPQKELDGLVARETGLKKVILPVWHELGVETIRRYSPILADKVATSSDKGLNKVVEDLLMAIQ